MNEPANKTGGGRAMVLLSVGAVLVILGWTFAARGYVGAAIDEASVPSIDRARADLDRQLAVLHARLRGECQIIAADRGLRSLFELEKVDKETILDQIRTLGQQLDADLLALVSADGSPFAVHGHDTLAQVDLRRSRVIMGALASTSTTGSVNGLWGSSLGLVPVAGCAVRFGDQKDAVVVVGVTFEAADLEAIKAITGTGGAVLIGDNAVAAPYPSDPALIERIKAIRSGAAAQISHGGSVYWVRADEVGDPALPVRLLWWRPRMEPSTQASMLIYLPSVLSTSALAAWIARRRRAA